MKKFWKWAVILMTATMAAGLATSCEEKTIRNRTNRSSATISVREGSWGQRYSCFPPTIWCICCCAPASRLRMQPFQPRLRIGQKVLLFPTSALATINIRFEWHSHCAHLCWNVSGHMFSFWGKEIIQIDILFNHA